ncbi:MAG: hypothetical protein MOB07_25790 [Acidobacteria bacterium]|nr:hypothetical protein [Acidobacteriota bacterium]
MNAVENNSHNRLLAPQSSSFRQYAETYDEMMKICEETGRKPYEVLRDALDEWLRLRRAADASEQYPPQNERKTADNESIAELRQSVRKLIEQNEMLIQYLDRVARRDREMEREILAACYGAIDLLWRSHVVPALRKKGRTPEQIETQYEHGRQEWAAQCRATVERIEEALRNLP